MKKFSLFMFGVLMALPGFARDFTYTYQGTTLTYTVLNEDAKTCKTKDRVWQDASSAYEPKLYIEGQLVIPAVAKDGDTEYSVTSIGERSFVNCSALSSVLIPNSVTEIGEDAFSGCSGLNKLAYPSGLRGIYLPGIAYAYPREGAIIEDGVVYGPEKKVIYFVPISAKGGYVIPNSVTEIGEYAFRSCSGLYSVIIPNSVTKIGANAFRSCSVLQSVFIPTSVTEIGYGAFADCNILMKSAYPSGLSNPFPAGIAIQYPREGVITEDGVVYGADKGTIYFAPLSIGREFVIPNTVSTIEDNAFAYCYSLKSVIIPPSVTAIGENAFANCDELKKTAYPSGLTNPFSHSQNVIFNLQYPREGAIIEDGVVYGADKNTIYFASISLAGEYVIPASVSAIGKRAFLYCEDLTAVKAERVTPPVMADDSFSGLYTSVVLSVPDNAGSNYLATNWAKFENLKSGDSECRTYETGNLKYCLIPAATEGDKNLAIVVPGDYSSLTEITIPERITVSDNSKNTRYYVDGIGYRAFEGCRSLATVTYNSQNASKIIGDYAFANTKISQITIPKTVETIGDFAFNSCRSLTGIVIPGSVRTIGNRAFFNTSNLTEITLNEGLESIGEEAFQSGSDYRTISPVYIPSTLKSVEKNAFKYILFEHVGISDLEAWCNIDFENSESNPAHWSDLYLNGEKIENLVIPESVKIIKDYAFCNVKYETVTLNEGLQRIGNEAFGYIRNDVVIPGTVTFIGERAFASTNLKNVTFEYGAEAIEVAPNAFPYISKLSWDRPGEGLNLEINSLKSLTIGNSVTEIPAASFKHSYHLTDLTLGNSLTAIGDEAFNSDNNLTEVILPPSVESIGASAFARNSKLTSIIMGHNVKTIGEKAFDGCPAQTVSVTAQTPPAAADNTFSNYTGSLYVQGQEAVKAYYDADFCWFQFEGHVMIEPTELKVEGGKTLTGKPGDTFQLTAKLYPEDVTLPQIFWRSTNPEIATVDANGLVTLHADMSDIMAMAADESSSAHSCKIIAESLYADGPVAEVTVNNTSSGIDEIVTDEEVSGEIDFTAPVEVYNLQGVMVGRTTDNLATGFYIVRQGKNVKKIAVK